MVVFAVNNIWKNRPKNHSALQLEYLKSVNINPFSLYDIENKENTYLKYILQKKASKTLVIFWASWCSPCLQEMIDLRELLEERASSFFSQKDIIFINVDEGDQEKVLSKTNKITKKYLKNKDVFRKYFDSKSKLLNALRISKLPFSMIVNKEGFIENIYYGRLDFNEIHQKYFMNKTGD